MASKKPLTDRLQDAAEPSLSAHSLPEPSTSAPVDAPFTLNPEDTLVYSRPQAEVVNVQTLADPTPVWAISKGNADVGPIDPETGPFPPGMPMVALTAGDLTRLENQLPGLIDKLVALNKLRAEEAARLK